MKLGLFFDIYLSSVPGNLFFFCLDILGLVNLRFVSSNPKLSSKAKKKKKRDFVYSQPSFLDRV